MEQKPQLSDVLSEFARTMLTDFPIQDILDHLVRRIVEILPITAAGVTLISDGVDPRYVAASDGSALRYEELQSDLAEGPCLLAYDTGQAVSVPDLRDEPRFGRFTAQALGVGLFAVFTFPLRQGEKRLGALDLYRDQPGQLSPEDLISAQTLADVTSAYLLNAQGRADLELASAQSHADSVHDPLTGLPNRTLLLEHFEHALQRNRRSGKFVAILYVDLDGFKAVNDAYGHHMGDRMLIAVARRISSLLRPGDTLARMSGDEFVILCEDLDEEEPAHHIASRVVAALASVFALDEHEIEISASVGVAFAGVGVGESDVEGLLQEADAAMYQVKRKGGAGQQVVDLAAQAITKHNDTLKHDLKRAIETEELRLEYQPIIRLGDGRVIGAEALLRWDHPTLGLVAPTMVIPVAEASGEISKLGRWVLERACLDSHRWSTTLDLDNFVVAVNVSVHQLMAPDFWSLVMDVLAETNTTAKAVMLEITESVFLRDPERALLVLNELKDRGVRLALDDFGTGFSSLSYLDAFPVDVVKLDQAFVSRLGGDGASSAIALKIIELAHLLSLEVISEGIETSEQRLQIMQLGGELGQGFYLARPMSADNLDRFLASASAGD